MVSLQHPKYGVKQANAITEIDPGPHMLTPHESTFPLRTSSPQMTKSTTAAETPSPTASSHRPAEQELVLIFGDQTADIGWDGKLARGTNGSNHGPSEVEGGITFEHPECSCPFALGFPGAIHEEKAFGNSRHLRTHLSGMSVKCLRGPLLGPYAIGEGSDKDGIRGQSQSETSPTMLHPPALHNMTIRPLDDPTSFVRREHVLPRTARHVEFFRKSYDAVVIGSRHGGDVARVCTLRAGVLACAPKGGQEKGLYDYPKVEKEAADEQNWSKRCAHQELGDALRGRHPTGVSHLIFGKGQHASLRNDLGGMNANDFQEGNANALGTKASPEEVWNNVPCRDNVNKTVTSDEAPIDEAEKSFDVKWKATMKLSSDNPLSDQSSNNLLDTNNSAPIQIQPVLGRVRGRLGRTSPLRTSMTSSRAPGLREQGSIASSCSTRLTVSETNGYLGFPVSAYWANGPQMNSSISATDVTMKETLMWMIAYNLITSPSESESMARLWDQSAQLLLNLVAAAISCFHFQFSPMVQRTNLRAKQCTGTVHCLLEDPG